MSALLQYSYAMLIFVNDIGCGLSVQRKYCFTVEKPTSERDREEEEKKVLGTLVDN